MAAGDDEDELLHSVALRNSQSILIARQRAEEALVEAKEALRESNDRITNILTSITDGFIAVDNDWRFTYVNAKAHDILRASHQAEETLVGANFWSEFPEFAGTQFEPECRRAMAERVTIELEFFYQLLQAWFAIRIYPAKSGLAIYFQDVTKRRHAEQELRQQREWFRVTLASIGDAVITTDVAGRVTFLNAVAQSLTGWTPDDAAGQPLERVFDIITEKSRRPVDNPALRALREGVIVGLANHTLLLAKHGKETPIDDSAAPIRDAGGGIAGAVLVFRDITERKRAEDALREGDRRKDEFLATLAHELRNPLAPLRNALELMRHRGSNGGDDPAQFNELREIMERQVRQMVRLVDDLLDVARISRGKLEMRLRPMHIETVVDNALEMCAPVLKQAGHDVRVSLPAQRLAVNGDATRLTQVVCNLLNNAAKFSEAGGSIELSVARHGGEVALAVKDHGIGIPADKLEEIFAMFSQLDHSLERSRSGLGLGLPLALQIVQMHGGTIRASSDGAGRGSEFVVRLPELAVPAVAAGCARPALTGAGQRKMKILIADDNQDSADSMGMLLAAKGHEVQVVYDGLGAVEAANRTRPDAILLDIGMPKLNGYDVARDLRRQEWCARTLLIALTGWGQDDDKRRSEQAGFDRHLIKPVDPDLLEETLRASRNAAAS